MKDYIRYNKKIRIAIFIALVLGGIAYLILLREYFVSEKEEIIYTVYCREEFNSTWLSKYCCKINEACEIQYDYDKTVTLNVSREFEITMKIYDKQKYNESKYFRYGKSLEDVLVCVGQEIPKVNVCYNVSIVEKLYEKSVNDIDDLNNISKTIGWS